MPIWTGTTTRAALPRPLGNQAMTRAAFLEFFDDLDTKGGFLGVANIFTQPQRVSVTTDTKALQIGGTTAGHESAMYVTPYGAAAVVLASGAERSGGTYIARAGSAGILEFLNGSFNFYSAVSLTPPNTFTPTLRLTVLGTGDMGFNSSTVNPGGTPSANYLSYHFRGKPGSTGTPILQFSGSDDVNGYGVASFHGVDSSYPDGNRIIAAMAFYREGGTAGNRGGAIQFYTKPDGASGHLARLQIDSNGTIHHFQAGGAISLSISHGTTATLIQQAANGALVLRSASNAYIAFDTDGGTRRMMVDYGSPPSDQTAISLMTNNGGSVLLRKVYVGAADSGGTGYRMLRVPN